MRLLSLLLALVLMWTGAAYASGRAACRVVFGPPLWGVCYAEQVVWAQGPLEVAVGLEARTWPQEAVAAYSLIGLYLPGWWMNLEVGRGLEAWRWALGAGVRW